MFQKGKQLSRPSKEEAVREGGKEALWPPFLMTLFHVLNSDKTQTALRCPSPSNPLPFTFLIFSFPQFPPKTTDEKGFVISFDENTLTFYFPSLQAWGYHLTSTKRDPSNAESE